MQPQDIASQPVLVTDNETLRALCEYWRRQPVLGLDSEFMRVDTFYPHAGLIQVADDRGCYLLDPLALTDLAPLREVLVEPGVLKILHACSEDLEVFKHCLDCVPEPVFDTQIAEAFLGQGLSVSYQKLIAHWFDIELEKEETRSDWHQRPLTAAQQHYAALDVAYLASVYRKQREQLEQRGVLAWCLEECAQVIAQAKQPPDDDSAYQRVKQAWRLKRRNQAVLQRLCAWREQQARVRDVPRNRVLRERSLWSIAFLLPQNKRDLARAEELKPSVIKRDGDVILSIVQAVLQQSPEQWPAPLPAPLPPRLRTLGKRLRAELNQVAERYQIAPELLLRKRQLESLLRSGEADGHFRLPPDLQGWRLDVVGPPLRAVLASITD